MSDLIDNNALIDNQSTSPSSNQNSTSVNSNQTSVQIADINAFIKYLKQFVPVLLDANFTSINDFDKCLNDKSSVECIKKFLGESQVRTLIIQRFLTKGKLR